jgi:hypothetical protein
MGTYTPGPWRGGWVVHGQTPIIGSRKNGEQIPGTARVVCHIPESLRDEEGEANVRLIAAAPDLLEACKAVQMYGMKGKMPDDRWAFDLLAAAITKAEGRD